MTEAAMSSSPGIAAGHADDDEFAWYPSETYLARSRLRRFIEATGCSGLGELQRRAETDPEWYWGRAVEFLGVTFLEPYRRVLDLSAGMAWPEWFPGARYNYVHDALDRHALGERRNTLAVIWEGDDGEVRKLSYRELRREVNRLANALRRLGIRRGDRVAIFLPMLPETVVAVLAVGKIGAVFVPMFSGFGPEALTSRIRDSGATTIITADGFFRRGSPVSLKSVADQVAAVCDGVRQIIVLQRSGADVPMTPGRDVWWHDLVAGESTDADLEPTRANDPYMIIYTSGTTGRPKGTVHLHAGFPIKATHDLAFCFDLAPDDTLFWLTDLGWMMGPWLIAGGLMNGATILLFEGTPDYPGPDRLWKLVEDHGITVCGIAPTAIRALMGHGEEPVRAHDLSGLRVLGSTGETWNPIPWRWFFEVVGGGRCPIINYSGGTEIGGGIVGCTTIQPQKPCSFTGPVPGMAADVVDDAGNPVRGSVGELVVRQPWVGMTCGFWQDLERYLETYWSRFPDTWVHGDWAEVDEDGAWFIRGRSDDTIKVAGKRVGPAEVESVAVAHPQIREAAAVGVPDELKGEAVIVFAVPKPEVESSGALAEAVRTLIGERLGGALRPRAVYLVADLPKTRNAKIMRRVARAAFLGQPTGDISSLENPACVDAIARLGTQARCAGG